MTWWVISGPDGDRQVRTADGVHPADCGEDVAGKVVTQMQGRGDPRWATPDLETGEWVEKLDEIKAALIAEIDAMREKLQAAYLTPGSAKATVYAQKAKEVAAYYGEGAEDYPAASAEAAQTGETLDEVMARIKAAIDESNSKVYKIEAIAQEAKRATRAASSASELPSVSWSI